ncbi:MAG: hydroxymethylbilane synthase [Verrucomicrobiia bacterium]
MKTQPIIIATRGSALALAQTEIVKQHCRTFFPKLEFEVKIIKTTGDKIQRASVALPAEGLPKGLFTKELEVALIKRNADMAVHSLKDLPTDLPAGLKLGAVLKRADVRDTLIYRENEFHNKGDLLRIEDFPPNAVIATTSTRRRSQILMKNPSVKVQPVRGNVITRLQKLATNKELSAMILAFAGLERLNFKIDANGRLTGDAVPDGLIARRLDLDEMLPCAGQAAIGIEIRADDLRLEEICRLLNHYNTYQCVTAERAFLKAMGGGCQSPVAVCAEPVGETILMQAISFQSNPPKTAREKGDIRNPVELGERVANLLK